MIIIDTDYNLIRINNVYCIKNKKTGELLNTTKIEDLRRIRDLMNEVNIVQLEEYRTREHQIRGILGCQ